jgi:hypothetical protein
MSCSKFSQSFSASPRNSRLPFLLFQIRGNYYYDSLPLQSHHLDGCRCTPLLCSAARRHRRPQPARTASAGLL